MPSSASSSSSAARARRSHHDGGSGSGSYSGILAEIRSPTIHAPAGSTSLPSPASAPSPSSSSSGGGVGFMSSSTSGNSLAGLRNTSLGKLLLSIPRKLSRAVKRRLSSSGIRIWGGGSAFVLVIVLLLLFVGAFDPDLHVGPHIDSRTFQVLPNGDPRVQHEPEYTKPPNYWEFVAEWNKPSYDLLANAPPSQRTCNKQGPLLFIGLFTHPGGVGRRQILRTVFKPDLFPEGYRIDYKFIVGRPPDDDWRYLLDAENRHYNDIAILEDVVKDNIDEGKSIHYFKWLAKHLPDPKPQFVMKMDDDTFLVMPNVIRNLSGLDCNKSIYWGTTQGANEGMFGRYMRGLCYGMSWPLASWIGTANITDEYAVGIEDARIGRLVQQLDPSKEPVEWIDHGWKMGDWDQLTVDENIVAFHWLKLDHWVPMVKRKALKAFADAGRAYRWDWEKEPLAKPPAQEPTAEKREPETGGHQGSDNQQALDG